jgi:V8-like Glu-specific endopeptidase
MKDRSALERESVRLGISNEVFAPDSKTGVTDNGAVPFRWICHIETTLLNGDSATGTGFLIGPRHVLTTAHTIYPIAARKVRPDWKVRKIRVFPGRHGSREPFGGHEANGWILSERWLTPEREADCTFDYGLIRLREDFLKKRIGCWGSDATTRFAPVDPPALAGRQLFTAGYPFRKGLGELAARVMTQSNGRVTGSAIFTRCTPVGGGFDGQQFTNVDRNARVLLHDVDTVRGSSGSPLWIRDGDVLTLGALHQGQITRRDGTVFNTGIIVSREVHDQIQNWIRTFVERR